MTKLPQTPPRRGFTLMETALATVIVGVGTLGLFSLVAACTGQLQGSGNLTAGMNLARNIRELTLNFAFEDPQAPGTWGLEAGESAANPATWDDMDDINGVTISPPITSTRLPMSSMSAWAQKVTVKSVDPDRLTTDVPNGTSPAKRITVTITNNGKYVCELSWYVFDGRVK